MSWLLCLVAVVSVGHWVTVDAATECSWKEYPETNIVGGVFTPAWTLGECQSACLANSGCQGVDWNPTTKGCWIHSTHDEKKSTPDLDHYDYVCPESCPAGFIYLELAKSCYNIVYEAHTWESARTRCQQLDGAHLADLTSQDENSAVKSYLELNFATNPGSGACTQSIAGGTQGKSIWIGGQRLDAHSCSVPFVWKPSENDQLPLNFTDWRSGEPNCDGNTEHCMNLVSIWKFLWNDVPCQTTMCALCEHQPA